MMIRPIFRKFVNFRMIILLNLLHFTRIPLRHKINTYPLTPPTPTAPNPMEISMLKSHLQKLDGLTHSELKHNITNTIRKIPQEKYKNIFKCAYERPEKYLAKNKTRKIKKNYL